jgi:hypothetical protein
MIYRNAAGIFRQPLNKNSTRVKNGKNNEAFARMVKQQSYVDMEYANRKRKTRRDEFLAIMEKIIQWDEWVALAEPCYTDGEKLMPTARDRTHAADVSACKLV